MRGPVCPFRLLCISEICTAYVCAAAKETRRAEAVCDFADLPHVRRPFCSECHIIFAKRMWFPLAVVHGGYPLWLLCCRPRSPFKKEKNPAGPQREILFLAVLRMDRLCNIHATSEALSALCGYVYECVCDYVAPRLVSSSSYPPKTL